MRSSRGSITWVARHFAPVAALALLAGAERSEAATLVGHWSLDEGTGTTVGDSSVNNLDGTLTGPGVTWVSGQISGGLSFDSSTDHVSIPHNAVMNFTDRFTLSFWVNAPPNQPGTGGLATLIDKSHGGTNGQTGWTVQSSTVFPADLFFALGTGTAFPDMGIPGVLDNTWHHVSILVTVVPSLTMRAYRDGNLVNTFSDGSTTIGNNSGTLLFGAWWGSGTPARQFEGKLDDVRLFAGLLNPCEIAAMANPAGFSDCNNNGVADSCDINSDGVGPNEHRVFVSSVTHNGNFGGLAGADAICQSLAQNAGLRRTYMAIMSDATNAANARLTLNGGAIYIFDAANQAVVVKANGNLWDGQPLDHALNLDEMGLARTGKSWTGTQPDGTASLIRCNNWTDGLGDFSGANGISESPTSWLNAGVSNCSLLQRLYCVSQQGPWEDDCNNNAVPDSCEPDNDSDGLINACDNCPDDANPGQEESDGDGVADACDNCPALANADQTDADGDAIGDVCDSDVDGDGVDNGTDACPNASACVLSDASGRPRSDLNLDCVVNGPDVQPLVNCILGGGAACTGVDPDGDGQTADVDHVDDMGAFVGDAIAPEAAPCE